jgi:uncharacterized protein (DUF4415 family)
MQKKENITKYSAKKLAKMQDQSDWKALKNMSEKDLENNIKSDSDSDTHIPKEFAGLVVGMPQHKELISIRLDQDILEWFRGKGKGYQTYINNILRSYVSVQKQQQEDHLKTSH